MRSVVAGIDGGSLTVMKESEATEIDLYGIDCPKKTADFGKAAKELAPEWS